MRAIRFVRSSSRTVRARYPDALSSPRVLARPTLSRLRRSPVQQTRLYAGGLLLVRSTLFVGGLLFAIHADHQLQPFLDDRELAVGEPQLVGAGILRDVALRVLDALVGRGMAGEKLRSAVTARLAFQRLEHRHHAFGVPAGVNQG